MQHPPSSVGKALGMLALVFFSGFATGLLTSNVLAPGDTDSFRIEATMQDLSGQLGLNPSQMEQIRVILDDVILQEADLLGELHWNQLEARRRIANHLTAEQNEVFEGIIQSTLESR